MENSIFHILYYLGVLGAYLARIPALVLASRTMKKEDRKSVRQKFENEGYGLGLAMIAWWFASSVLPLFYIFTDWLNFANYSIPDAFSYAGGLIFLFAIFVLGRGHYDLGKNWSSTVQIQQEQDLVTQGIYHFIRHPIYAAHLLWGVAGVLLLHNWVAGWSGLVLFILIYLLRVPHEEAMMVERFGDEYRTYMQRTGGVIPKRF